LVDDYTADSTAQDSANDLIAKYREMAADSERERDAEEWCEGLIADIDFEPFDT